MTLPAFEARDGGAAEIAVRLLAEAGLPALSAMDRLTGGKNNRVFQLLLEDGTRRVLKLYHVDPRDDRDRLGAEWRFLTYVWERGVRSVPRPIAADRAASAGLYDFVEGRKLGVDEIDEAAVVAAAKFIAAINAEPHRPEQLAPGSEACFTLTDHMATIDRRVARLSAIDREAPMADEAERFVVDRLRPAWRTVETRILDETHRRGLDRDAPVHRVIVSPSDFGFHNMLRDENGRLTVIDFEYAGRDDPAKLVCDFFCQPELPVPFVHFGVFTDRIAEALGFSDDDRHRCTLLVDAYRIKWVCIILNEFLDVGSSRRAFADDGSRALRCAGQLERAERRLAIVTC